MVYYRQEKVETKKEERTPSYCFLCDHINDLYRKLNMCSWNCKEFYATWSVVKMAIERHPKCSGCTLLFGVGHLAVITESRGNEQYCQYCTKEEVWNLVG